MVGLPCALAVSAYTMRAPATPWPVARVGFAYGYLGVGSTFEGQAATNQQALAFRVERGVTAIAQGPQASIALVIETSYFAACPYVSGAYLHSNATTFVVRGKLDSYSVRVNNYASFYHAGTEFQFWRRVLLADVGLGFGKAYSRYSLPGFSGTQYQTDESTALLLHLGVGLRAPIRFPVTLGSKFTLDAFPLLAQQSQAVLSIFAEIDPFFSQRQP
jgi:hypothetical protein